MLKTNLNNFPPSSLQPCRFTISRRKRPAEPLQHGAHGTGWGAAATAAHVPQLRWQFRGRVLNNAECPKSSCHTRNYCLTREGRIEREKERSQGKLQWHQHENENEKSSKEEKSTGTPAIPLIHTHHTHLHTHTHLHSLKLELNAKISISTFLFLILLLNLRSGHFWIFFIIFIRIFLLL